MKNKKIVLGCIFIIFVLFISGCKGIYFNTNEKIVSPENKFTPLEGTWEVKEFKKLGRTAVNNKEIKKLIGTKAIFGKEVAYFNGEVCYNPEYNIKNVDTEYYFLYNYKVNYRDFIDIKNKKLEVISMMSSDKIFYEFIKINENEIYIYMNQIFFKLKKISNNIEIKGKIKEDIAKTVEDNKQEAKGRKLKSGILIALSSDSDEYDTKYRTLWVSSIDSQIQPIQEKPLLFVPRKKGFWIIGVDEEFTNNNIRQYLYEYPIDKKNNYQKSFGVKNLKDNIIRKIKFISNDYICTEYYNYSDDYNNGKYRYQVFPIDNLKNDNSIKLSDIAGKEAKSIFYDSGKAYFNSHYKLNCTLDNIGQDNFTVKRKNGHWIIGGGINFRDKDNTLKHSDFNVNIIPSEKLIDYDDLCISWNDMKSKVDNMVDAFTSPNKDIALILTNEYMYVYSIYNGKLSSQPSQKIKMKNNKTVIMSQWATGDYVQKWNKAFNSLPN